MLSQLSDKRLHEGLLQIVSSERALLTEVLNHLCEVARRKLYCDFGRSSLFDYAVHELGYSEDQAHRRIQAMRLVQAVPEVAEKLTSGALTLTNAAMAQGIFRRVELAAATMAANLAAREPDSDKSPAPSADAGNTASGEALMSKEAKLEILGKIERRSAREAEKVLLPLRGEHPLPPDGQRVLTGDHIQLKVVVDKETSAKLEKVRGLLGAKGALMSHAELFSAMADLSIAKLEEKKFGKRRTGEQVREQVIERSTQRERPMQNEQRAKIQNPRYVPQKIKHAVWRRDGGKCTRCQSQRNLQFDHVQPVGLGGETTMENLRLLCFSCNQRAAMRVFGIEALKKRSVSLAASVKGRGAKRRGHGRESMVEHFTFS